MEQSASSQPKKPLLLEFRSSKWLIGFTVFVAAFNVSSLLLLLFCQSHIVNYTYIRLRMLTIRMLRTALVTAL